jgi:bifunctional DNase/RNase
MHRVTVKDVQFSKVGFVMLLESQLDQRVLPVFIAPGEAQAILVRLKGIESKRPLTHDLMRQFLDDLGVEVRRVVIHALDESTDIFYATILYAKDGTIRDIDARPSDAVALALRCGAPIWVDPSVMDKAGVEPGRIRVVEPSPVEDPPLDRAPAPRPVTEEDIIASLEERLQQAVHDERYEDAARLRDQIDELKHIAGR